MTAVETWTYTAFNDDFGIVKHFQKTTKKNDSLIHDIMVYLKIRINGSLL